MIKKIIFGVSVVVNIILLLAVLSYGLEVRQALDYIYVRKDAMAPESIRSYLERENYGVAAAQSHRIRGGAEIADEYMDYYMLGEYADLLFLKVIFEEAGNTETLEKCEERLEEIRTEMPAYGSLFDKMEISAKNAIPETEEHE